MHSATGSRQSVAGSHLTFVQLVPLNGRSVHFCLGLPQQDINLNQGKQCVGRLIEMFRAWPASCHCSGKCIACTLSCSRLQCIIPGMKHSCVISGNNNNNNKFGKLFNPLTCGCGCGQSSKPSTTVTPKTITEIRCTEHPKPTHSTAKRQQYTNQSTFRCEFSSSRLNEMVWRAQKKWGMCVYDTRYNETHSYVSRFICRKKSREYKKNFTISRINQFCFDHSVVKSI